MMKILKIVGFVFLLLIVAFGIFLVYFSLTDYNPQKRILIFESKKPDTINLENLNLSFLCWNIGYGGLGKEMDFFYDGGTNVRTTQAKTIKNLNEIKKFILKNDSVDFILLQEIDICSKRSYFIDEAKAISYVVPDFFQSFGTNYLVKFVPVPLANPMGKTNSGLLTLSRYIPVSSERFNLPGDYPWPKKLFMLDRCILVNRYILTNCKQLIVVNIHNSAFDDGSLKKQEMNYLIKFILEEYNKGNYICAGGDWNQNPPGFQSEKFISEIKYENFQLTQIEYNCFPDNWKWGYDRMIPTNRSLKASYDPILTSKTILDFYLISPNLEYIVIQSHDLGFENSDHQPVFTVVRAKK
jgi:endonuclease/exonuclease/phosphatase family metal-dependent hydrolase